MDARRRWVSHVPRTVALAAAVVAAVGLGAWNANLLAHLDPLELATIALFAAGFAALTFACDAELRAALRSAFRKAAAKSPGAKRVAT